MANITTRTGKGSALTHSELDDNFTNLNTDKAELSGADFTGNVSVDGNISVTGTVDGRDVATDGTKLDGIEASADVTDTTNVVASLTAGTNITIAADGTISATDTDTQLTNEQVQDIVGAMLSGNTETGITVTYQDADGTIDFVVDTQTDQNFTTALKNKLDAIEAGATADQTAAEIRALVESATDSNVFTDADHSKLDGIEANADVTDTDNVVASLTAGTNITIAADGTISATDTDSVLTSEQVQDIVGAMVSGNTETGITVTYQDADGTIDFVVASQTDENFTTTLKNKLDAIEANADVTDTTNVVASLTAGTNVTIAADGTISATDTNTQLTTEQVQDIVGAMFSGNTETGIAVTYQDDDGTVDFVVTTQSDENFTTVLKNKLDGIESGAEVNTVDSVNTQTGAVVLDADDINDSATTNKFTTAGDISKLAGIEAGATADQTDAEIRAAVEAATDSNVFTDADHTKLDGIEANADVTDTDNVVASLTAGSNITISAGGVIASTASGAVDSVNTQTGAVVLDADDISDSTTTNKFTTAADISKLAGIEAGATADQTASEIRALVESATDSNVFTDADHTKLDGIEASADVTDTANVTAAGAVMDSELTSEASVKALNQGVATTDSPTFAGLDVGAVSYTATDGTDGQVLTTDGSGNAAFESLPAGTYLNVKDFGATGDGSTDDTDDIQDAIDHASNHKIQTIFFPDGHYKFTTLRFYHDASDPNEEFRDPADGIRDGRFQLVGTGRMALGDTKAYDGTSTTRIYGSVLESTSSGEGLIVDPNAQLGDKPDARNFVIRNMTVIADNGTSVIKAESCPGLTIDHCTIKQLNRFGNGIIARNCWFFNMHQTYVFGESVKFEKKVTANTADKTNFTYTFDSPSTQEELVVSKSGQLLELTNDYTVNLSTKTVSLTTAAVAGDAIRIKRTKKIEEATTVTNASTLTYGYTFDNPDDSTGIAVYKNGILLEEGASKDYTVVMSTTKQVTLISNPTVGDVLIIKKNDTGVGLSGQFVEGTAGEFGNFAGMYTISHSAIDNFEDGIRWTGGKVLNYAVRDTGLQNCESYCFHAQRGTLQPLVLDNVYFENPQFPGVSYVKSRLSSMPQLSMLSCFMLGGTTASGGVALKTNIQGVAVDLYEVATVEIHNNHVFRPTTGFLHIEKPQSGYNSIGRVSNTVYTTDATDLSNLTGPIPLVTVGTSGVFPALENNVINGTPGIHEEHKKFTLYDSSNETIPQAIDARTGVVVAPKLSIGHPNTKDVGLTTYLSRTEETYTEFVTTTSGARVFLNNDGITPDGRFLVVKNSSDSTENISFRNQPAFEIPETVSLTPGSTAFLIFTKDTEQFTGTGNQTYTYSFDSPSDQDLLAVYINGTKEPFASSTSSDPTGAATYTVNLTNQTITFNSGAEPASGDKVVISQYSYKLIGVFSESAGSTGDITGVTAGTGLTGGGTSGSVTLNVSDLTVSELAAGSLQTSSESFSDSDTALMTAAAINDRIESFGYTTNTGDITGVTAGDGLSGGATSGTATLAVDGTVARTTGDTFTGDVTFDSGTNTTVDVVSNDNGESEIRLYGGNQGTGRVYVGQDTSYGGGIEYLGDGTPASSGAGNDYITLYRQDNGTRIWTARNSYANNNWEFRGNLTVNGASLTNTLIGQWNTAYGWGDHAAAGYTSNVGDITNVTAGTGLTGGGASGSVTLNVNTGAVANGAATIPTGDQVYDFVVGQGYTSNTGDITGVTAGTGLSGGGASGSVTLNVDLSELTDMTATMVGTDEFIVLDAGADRRKAANEIGLSVFNNDSGFTSNAGDITAVTAGTSLSGGGTSGSVTLNVATPTDAPSAWSDVVGWNSALIKDAAVEIHGSGYLRAAYLNMTHGVTTRNSESVFFSSTDEYIRKNNATGMRSSLNVPTRTGGDASGTWGINITGSAGTLDGIDSSQFLRSDTADTMSGNLTVNARLDVGNGSGSDTEIRVYKGDNNVSDHIQFYNGTTRMGEIGCQDTSWLRINQVTAKNIYTPRYIRADGGFFVDGSTKGINGSGNFIGGTITGASDANVSNWDTAYSWGNHAAAGYTSNVGDITAVTAGTNLTGGGTSGSVTLNMATGGVGAGTYGSTNNGTKIDTITVDAYGRVTAVATGATGSGSGTGDITAVTAGDGLYGGGTSGSVTLHVGAGGGISVDANSINVDSTVVRTTGSTFTGQVTMSNALFNCTRNNNNVQLNRTSTTGKIQTFRYNSSEKGFIQVLGGSVNYSTTSDRRLKENIVDAPSASNLIDQIQVRSFDWKESGEHQQFGMVAQELQQVAPEAVADGDTEEDMMGVDYSKLVPMLVKEIQELRARVAELEEDRNNA